MAQDFDEQEHMRSGIAGGIAPGDAAGLAAPPPSARMLAGIAAITSVEFFETGLVMFSASPIMAGLSLIPEEFALAYTLYGVAAIFMLYKHQWMVERLGYRDFILGSLLVFALGGILCATATGVDQFTLGRILQGAGGATFFVAGRMEINRLPPESRFQGLLCFVGSLLGASAIAPVAAALLLGLGGWRALFWCIVPLAITVALIAGPHLSRATVAPGERSEEHWGWLLWLVLGIFGLQYAIHEIPSASNAARSPAFVMGAASAAALTLFAWRQWKKDRPLIDYRSLLQWRYLLGLTLYFFGYFMAGTSGFLLPIFFREGLGLPLTTTALVLSFGLFGSVAAAMLHAAVARRRPRPLAFMMTGLALYAIVCLAFSQARLLSDWHLLLVPVLLSGIAVAFFFGPVAFGTFTELPPKVFSHGYQVKNIVRQLGISSSIALSTMALQFFYARRLAALPEGFHPEWAQALHGLSDASAGLVAPLTLACSDLFFVLALCALPVALLVMWQRTFR